MGAVAVLVRRSLWSNRRGIVAVACIVALAGGVALTALGGARRTASAFPRYLAASRASDLSVNIGPVDENDTFSIPDAVALAQTARSIDGVVGDASYVGLEAMYPVVDGELEGGEVLGSLDGRFIDIDSVSVRVGRRPRDDRLDEVFINESAAREGGVGVGDRITLQARTGFGEGNPLDSDIIGEEQVSVVGVGLFPDEVLRDDFDRSPRVLTTPALTNKYLTDVGSYLWQGLRLAPGTDVDQVIADYREAVGASYGMNVKRTDEQVAAVQRSIRPVVAGVAVFGLAAALAALALGILAGLRLNSAAASDAATYRALGLRRRHATLALGAPAVTAGVLGAVGAVLLALASSPVAPFGAVRSVEPDLGFDVDLVVLLVGGAALALLLAVAALIGARGALRRPRTEPARRARLVNGLTAAGAGPTSVFGAQQALGATGRPSGVPARSTLAACAVSVIAIVTALVFGGSVRALLDHPPRYGWKADVAVSFAGGYEPVDPGGTTAVADAPGVDAVSVAGYAAIELGHHSVSAMGLVDPGGPAPVTLLSGALPDGPDEVALGSTTARRLGLKPGDEVTGSDGAALDVTGVVAMPAIGLAAADHPSLGEGAVLTFEGLARRSAYAYPTVVFLDLAGDPSSADRARATALVAGAMTDGLPVEAASTYADLRPSEIIGLDPARATTSALAAVLGLAAVLALVVTLSSSVRRQGRTFATLRALGFDQRQVRATVRWQTNITIVVALLVGVPIGLIAGRTVWRAFAEDLGSVATPDVPWSYVILAALTLVVLANLAGELPARRAGRTSVRSLRDA